jgi:hypothetical protein
MIAGESADRLAINDDDRTRTHTGLAVVAVLHETVRVVPLMIATIRRPFARRLRSV